MGFDTNQKERDKSLTSRLNTLCENIQNDLSTDPDVLALFYGGSIGKGNQDLYSDIDLRIVVKAEVFETFRKKKKERAENWGDVLFYEDYPWASHSVAHFRNFIKVDSFYYTPKDLQPSLYLKQGTMIVYDPLHIVKEVVKRSNDIHYKLTQEEFEIWRGKFFAHLHEVYRRMNRGEMYYALSSLDMLRWSIAAGWDMEKDRLPNQMREWSKYEGKRSPFEEWQLSLLENWDCDRNPEKIAIVMKSICSEFKTIHKNLSEKLFIKEEPEWVDEIMKMVL
ncbi:hypothetical protein KUV80_04060 [Fictibacillus nanhaiensis]|uniref:nucleotidyltransferase domain-containing protein n=1 Tax=Fictibacillus nanhaiensis TaxID=742169 RepID=UPI001C9375D6|nr:nucleotidyltransferase domain-containing protein [Fictibacillus nanhaiensis]MBY6035809.1 hypothetical protein [Fictibacillus nanhaiensis]